MSSSRAARISASSWPITYTCNTPTQATMTSSAAQVIKRLDAPSPITLTRTTIPLIKVFGFAIWVLVPRVRPHIFYASKPNPPAEQMLDTDEKWSGGATGRGRKRRGKNVHSCQVGHVSSTVQISPQIFQTFLSLLDFFSITHFLHTEMDITQHI